MEIISIYTKTILNQVDIMAMSEHWLYEDELSFLSDWTMNLVVMKRQF